MFLNLIYCILGILVVFWILSVIARPSEKQKQVAREYFEMDEKCGRVLDSGSVKRITQTLEEMERINEDVNAYFPDWANSIHQENINDLKSELRDIEQEKWEKKADKYLRTFADCYEEIVSGDLCNFHDVELLMATKKKCINAWQNYFAIDLDKYKTTIYPKVS